MVFAPKVLQRLIAGRSSGPTSMRRFRSPVTILARRDAPRSKGSLACRRGHVTCTRQCMLKAHSAPTLAGGVVPEIDGLRGVAILLVLLHRLWPRTGELARYGDVAEVGWVGVDLFFVISGFLITGILLDTRGDRGFFKNFYARRALRIFPLYYLYVGGIFLLFPLLEGGAYMSTAFVREAGSPFWYLFYLGNVPEALLGRDPPYVLACVWSLAIEEQFYLTFPLLVFLLRPSTLRRVLLALVVGAPLLRLASSLLWPENERFQYQFTFCRVDVIAWGGLLALAVRSPEFVARWRTRARSLVIAVGVFALGVVAVGGLDRSSLFGRVLGYSVVGLAFAGLLFWVLANRGAGATAALRGGWIRFAGKLCYGLYLLHRPADVLVTKALAYSPWPSLGETLLGTALKFAVAFGLATLSWYAFESRVLRWKHRFDSSRHPIAASAFPPAPLPGDSVSDPRRIRAGNLVR